VLYAVLFNFLLKVAEENLFFFDDGKKRERKSSFANLGFGAGVAVCKCAFSFAVGFLFCFEIYIKRI